MGVFCWRLRDADGNELRSTQDFGTKEEAEEWMGREWASLADEGAESVSLMSDGEELYHMGLSPE